MVKELVAMHDRHFPMRIEGINTFLLLAGFALAAIGYWIASVVVGKAPVPAGNAVAAPIGSEVQP